MNTHSDGIVAGFGPVATYKGVYYVYFIIAHELVGFQLVLLVVLLVK